MTLRPSTMAAWAAVAASLALAAGAAWEIGSPLQAGHWASMAGCAIAAENMLRYHLFAAVPHYVAQPPPGYAQYYCRHPYAIYVMEALARVVFGHRPWAIRVPALVCSAATPLVLFRLGRELWGPAAAAIAATAFVAVPIDLAFASFSSLEVPTIFFGLLFCLGTVRAWRTGARRDIALSTLGALGASHSDWIGAVLVGLVVGFGVARGYLLSGGWRAGLDERIHRLWLITAGVATIGTLAFYALLIVQAGQLSDVLHAARMRSSAGDSLWQTVLAPPRLARRLMRLQWMVPGVGFAALAAALPVAVARIKVRPGEIVLIAWTVMATFQFVAFTLGADIHIFWPHYYGPCVALALGTLASALLPRRRPGAPSIARLVGLVVLVGLPMALLARVAIPMLDQSKLTQGRFDERGLYIESGADASQFAEWATRGEPRSSRVGCTRLCSWSTEYATGLAQIQGPIEPSPRAASDVDRIELVDARYTSADDLRTLAQTFDTVAVGHFLRVDRALPAVGVRAVRYEERQPTTLERLLVTDHDLVRAIGPEDDPWASWQWGRALGTASLPTPAGKPTSLEALAVAHNIARSRGDGEGASVLRDRALSQLRASTISATFTDDVLLLGVSVEHGPATVVTLLWEAGSDFRAPRESTFSVRCRNIEPPPLWPVPIDPLEKELAPPMTIKPTLWLPGELYVQRFLALKRPGTERCRGYFVPGEPRPANGDVDVDLFTLR